MTYHFMSYLQQNMTKVRSYFWKLCTLDRIYAPASHFFAITTIRSTAL